MRIYNSTISELQHFVTQPLILPILMAVNLHVLILKINFFCRSGHILSAMLEVTVNFYMV